MSVGDDQRGSETGWFESVVVFNSVFSPLDGLNVLMNGTVSSTVIAC